MKKVIILITILLLTTSCNLSNNQEPKKIKETHLVMDTFVEITVFHKDENKAREAISQAINEIKRLDLLLSRQREKSEISSINKINGENFLKVSDHLFEILKKSQFYGDKTDGYFDVTVGILMKNVWKFNEEDNYVPNDEVLKKYLGRINYKNIHLKEGNLVRVKKGSFLDVSALAKGYIVDHAVKVLKRNGIVNALINAGGDLKSIGERGASLPWRVGIQHPREHSKMLAVLEVNNMGIATSGDYQRYFILDNKRYHHILNPKTGLPGDKCMSVTITAKDVIDADAIATAVFVMGPDLGMKLIESLDGVEGLVIDISGSKFISSGLKGKITFNPI